MNASQDIAPIPVSNEFSDENLFAISTYTRFSDVANYFVS